jgi:hypothetical protein
VRFTDFLKATVLISAGAGTALAAVTVVGASSDFNYTLVLFAAIWWLVAGGVGLWMGRRAQTSSPIARLLANAKLSAVLPEVEPSRILVNRLWPLLTSTVLASGLAFVLPQVPAIATGFTIIWALAWRRQEAAVSAIEDRDAVRFYVERTSPLQSIRLLRTPGFHSSFPSPDGAGEVEGALDRT